MVSGMGSKLISRAMHSMDGYAMMAGKGWMWTELGGSASPHPFNDQLLAPCFKGGFFVPGADLLLTVLGFKDIAQPSLSVC